jgi:hypothetical protein
METIKEILQTKEVITEIKYQKFSLTKLVPLSFVAEVLRSESRDAIPLRGEGCNTLGVYHQLSSGFKLKHDRSSGDEDVKVNL